MECKEASGKDNVYFINIRILPEWNVKQDQVEQVEELEKIRILPEWNVKEYSDVETGVSGALESYQSGM